MKYNIIGENLQLVNIELKENEKVYAETGKFVYKSANVNIDAKIKGGFMGILFGRQTGRTQITLILNALVPG